MFKGREYQSLSEHPSQSRWQSVLWADIAGWARSLENEGFEDTDWEFSVELPAEADPASVKLGFSYDGYQGMSFYTVSYKLMNVNVWELKEIPQETNEGNVLREFSAHVSGELEREVGFTNMDRQSIREPLKL